MICDSYEMGLPLIKDFGTTMKHSYLLQTPEIYKCHI